ncbi:MAG: hypothetical protein QXT73_00415 [Candidatus Methanomethylicaceae archaeon]
MWECKKLRLRALRPMCEVLLHRSLPWEDDSPAIPLQCLKCEQNPMRSEVKAEMEKFSQTLASLPI